ncbi:MAG: carboxypeptidase regulatory-like domain-containing protein, partial [Actinobacteria bacterium]|nr:carboxypeptidase regulatory-like domain-containing protein [Actinomycetota bacterium]
MSSPSVRKRIAVLMGISLVLGTLLPLVFATSAFAADVTSISGTVTFQEPGSNESCLVHLYNADTEVYIAEASVTRLDLGWGIIIDATGYGFYNLEPGNYKVAFDPPSSSAYGSEWYNNKTSMDAADVVNVADVNDENPNINAYLEKVNSTISGYVKAQDTGDPVTSFYVQAYNASTDELVCQSWVWAAGDYKLNGFAPGQYKILYNPRYPDTRRNDPYMAEWYNDKYSMATADLITVSGPGSMALPDVLLAPGGSISGTVTGEDGNEPVADAYVEAYNLQGSFCGSADADDSGNYEIMGLPTGSYKVKFDFRVVSDKYLGEWYSDKKTQGEGDAVAVTMPVKTTGINAVLQGHGTVTGNVKDYADNPLDVCNVYLRDTTTENVVASGLTDSSGDYTIKRVPAGTYKVHFVPYDCEAGIHEWYNDKPDFASGDAITVNIFQTTANINAKLSAFGTISGNVKAEGSVNLNGVKVEAVRVDEVQATESGYTDVAGNYTITQLPEGEYKIQFKPQGATTPAPPEGSYYVSEYYDDKTS